MRNKLFLILAAVLCVLVVCPEKEAKAEAQPPVYTLRLAFDLEKALLKGEALIEIPASTPVKIYFEGFQGAAIKQDNESVNLCICSAETMQLSPSPSVRRVEISYTKSFANPEESPGNLITPNGITLTGKWYPALDQDAFFEVAATVPEGFVPIAQADADSTDRVTTQDNNELRIRFARPLPAIVFKAGSQNLQGR